MTNQSAAVAGLRRVLGQRKLALVWALLLGLLLPFVVVVSITSAAPAARPLSVPPPAFTVNTIGDAVAVAPLNDGICDTGYAGGHPNGICSLRAAIMKANHWPGGGATIILPAQAQGVAYSLDIPRSGSDDETTGDLNITRTMTILGGGASRTIVDGSGALDRVLSIGASAVVTLTAVTIQSGHAISLENGGGIDNYVATLILINSRIVGNRADDGAGGGVMNHFGASLTVYSSTIGNNTAFEGGGIESDNATLVMVNSTISGNHATINTGGGLFNVSDSTATLVNSTVSGNSTTYSGGGIGNAGFGSVLNLYNVTIANNAADSNLDGIGRGGGVYNSTSATGTVVLRNSLIAGNFASVPLLSHHIPWPEDCYGALDSGGYNLIEAKPNKCTLAGGPNDQVNVTAHIGPLQDNGGPTFTHALLPGSPAINAGNPGGCAGLAAAILLTDQRGRPRPATSIGPLICDIGAFEYQRTFYLFLPLVRR